MYRALAGMLLLVAVAFAGMRPAYAQAARAPKAQGPDVVWQLPWGGFGATAGRLDGIEGASEGPMSFALAPNGELVVLDQVNQRVAYFDGGGVLVEQHPIPASTFQEIEVLGDGTILLLDRLARRSLLVMSPSGQVLREVAIVGGAVTEGGLVTAMLVEPDGVWLEVGHARRVRVLDASLMPCPRDVLPGRPFRGDVQLMAALDGMGGAKLWLEEASTGNVIEQVDVKLPHRVSRIVSIQADSIHDVHVQLHLMEQDPLDPSVVTADELYGLRFDDALKQLASYRSTHTIRIWEQFREIRVLGDGTTYQMAFTPNGVTILRWRWV